MMICGYLCREYGHVCECATPEGYCMLTACVNHPPEQFIMTVYTGENMKEK